MAKLGTVVDAGGPVVTRADNAEAGEVFLVGPNRIPVMRTNQPLGGSPKSAQFVALSNECNVSTGTLLYYTDNTELFVVQSAKLVIKR